MKNLFILCALISLQHTSWCQPSNSVEVPKEDIGKEVAQLKEMIKQLQQNELQSDKSRYQKNYQLIVNGIEIVKEMHQGALEITGARSQNIFYKKLLDVNNPSSDVLGFQLLEVINKSMEDNINLLPLLDGEKTRLRGQVANVFDGLKKAFPPINIISSVVSMFSGFNTYRARVEKLGRKADSLVVDVASPFTGPILQKINQQLQPYIIFYSGLDKINGNFENALYQHEVQYRDYLDELNILKENIAKKINWDETIGDQITNIFDLSNSSMPDFNFKQKLENETVKDLISNCIAVYELVDRYKKFTNDFIVIQEDFYSKNLDMLQQTAISLPYKDPLKINQLVAELNLLKNGNPAEKRLGFDASYKMRLKSILTKLHAINKWRV